MSNNTYDVGNQVQLAAVFTNTAGAATDPTAITLRVRLPDNSVQTYTYAAAQVVKSSTGNYYYNYTTTQYGVHYYRFEGTGALTAASDNSFTVTASPTLGN